VDDEILDLIKAANAKQRPHAPFFGWPDKAVKEWGIAKSLEESLQADHRLFFSDLRPREPNSDPPDCEALGLDGSRIAIEVTELVDREAIELKNSIKQIREKTRSFRDRDGKSGNCPCGRMLRQDAIQRGHQCSRQWDRDHFVQQLSAGVKDKDSKQLKDAPYPGGYILVIHSDEEQLLYPAVERFLEGQVLERPVQIGRVFLILGYDPQVQRCPYFEIPFNPVA
jgi:hypothetical protein